MWYFACSSKAAHELGLFTLEFEFALTRLRSSAKIVQDHPT
jgi:hypothetical protein